MAKYKEKDGEAKRQTPVARDGAYVMMLSISLIAIVIGCVLMYLDTDEYSGKPLTKEAAPAIQKLGDPFKGSEAPAATTPAPGPGGP
ncbi:hypothetical protein [Frigoriglobus tundricola]|uniref:Uncharacterized protein n=1 Tax=Frigoriglobus tundricola TaxID=2774151 RepID=A0A6M5YS56_9BACT|nr:hypothetical protein [Frigoriglobus tundricola]QJW96270.1 hypothetical protein FTUN_3827 [Frigoriglobus tundricola]